MAKVKNNQNSAEAAADGAVVDQPTPTISIMRPVMMPLAATPQVEPLSADEQVAADRAVRRLHEQIRSYLGSLPSETRNASALARYLDVDRTTCQRLVFTATRAYTGLAMVDRMPGVRGLRQLILAARRCSRESGRKTDDEPLAAFEAAVDQFEQTLRALGSSQSSLARRAAAGSVATIETGRTAASEEPTSARQRLFESAAEITGRSSDTWVAVYVYHPLNNTNNVDHCRISVARAHGLIGHIAQPNAVPLTFHNFTSKQSVDDEQNHPNPHPFHSLNGNDQDDETPVSVLREFCTDPPPVVSSRQPGEYLVQAIDTDPSLAISPIDFMLGTRSIMPHPASQSPRIEEVWAMINFPVRRMVFDVYLHRDLARTCIPSLDMHLWRPDFTANVGDRWQTRFANGPRLEVLGGGISHATTSAYARHAELTSFLFERLELATDRFVGYRCAVEYPVWRTGYCMSFDFNAGEGDE